MARTKNNDSAEGLLAGDAPAETGTSRVISEGRPYIPAPFLPVVEKVKALKKAAKEVTNRVGQNLIAPRLHLDQAQNRLARLKNLARTSREVAWILGEYNRLTAKPNTK